MAKHGLKKTKETKTGLNTKFKDAKGNIFSKTDFAKNPSLRSRYGVHVVKKGKTTYIRSNPDGKKGNNLE